MIKTIILFFIFVTVALSGWQRQIWSSSTSCTGSVDITQVNDNTCGKSENSDNYYIIFFDSANKRYQINYYGGSSSCSYVLTTTYIQENQYGQCIPLTSAGPIAYGSQMITFWVACFPAHATVQLEDGSRINLENLKIGQKVASYRPGSNKPVYSEVYSFLDYDPEVSIKYLKIGYVGENNMTGSISISDDHLILAKRFGSENFVYARTVEVGDTIFQHENGHIVPVLVSSVTTQLSKGVYAPATLEGTVIIDGVVTSSYASVSHELSHAMLAPLRWAYWLSPSLVKTDSHGLHPYTKTLFNMFSKYVMHPDPNSWMAPYSLDSNLK